jgi:hypothetical protein
MKKQNWIFMRVVLITITATVIFLLIGFSNQENETSASPPDIPGESNAELVVLWTSGDREVAEKMVFMYVLNAKKYEWFKDITMIVWGPSAKLISEDNKLQDKLVQIEELGVKVKACKACADMYMVAPKLEELGIEVIYIGNELSDYIKGDYELLSI